MRREAKGRHLRRRPFARLWVGSTIVSTGDGLMLGAVPLLAVLVNPHPVAVSAVAAADSLPWLLMALPAGAFADRFERGPLMALCNVLRAVAILVAALLILNGEMRLWILIVVVLANSCGRAVYYSSYQAIVPTLVEPDALEHANGLLTGTEAGTEHLAGPVIGTTLFAAAASLPFFADAVTMLLSSFPLVRLRAKVIEPPQSATSMWEGIKLLFGDRRLRVLVLIVSLLAGLQGMETGILVLLATTLWGVRTGAYGVFLAAGALGNLLGSVLTERFVGRFDSGPTLIGTAIVSGIAYLAMAAAHGWQLAAPAYFVSGTAVAMLSVAAISLRQRLTPKDLMGRVGSAWRGVVWGTAPIGALLAGVLASLGGLRLPILLAGALQILVAIVFARPLLRSIREGAQGRSSGLPPSE
jgi:MFS family permease